MATSQFFVRLPVHTMRLSDLFGHEAHFELVPPDWHVIVTDIKNSTRAFEAGRHEEINLIATGCIISTLNLAYTANIRIPFFFGGDGATLLVPPELTDEALRALHVHRANTLDSFGLDLRVGAVRIDELAGTGHEVRIARFQVSEELSIPVVLGTGLIEAERKIKEMNDSLSAENILETDLNLEGMECRWDKVKPEGSASEVVSLIISTSERIQQTTAFKRVIECIDQIYGPYSSRNPVSPSQLKLDTSVQKLALETRTKLGHMDWLHLSKNWLYTQFGKLIFFRQHSGKQYLNKLVELTDTLVIDGRINTVIAGTTHQRQQLEASLNVIEQEGWITYGLFVSQESVMSCYVRDRKKQHIHFVDGSDGGYTRAATMWKRKRRK